MKVKKLKQLVNLLDKEYDNLDIKIFDPKNELIGDIENIFIEDHSGTQIIVLTTKIEDLK